MSSGTISGDLDKVQNTPSELKEHLHYGNDEQWELSMDKVKPRKFLDDEFEKFCASIRDASKRKTLAKKLLPTMEGVLGISERGEATVYKAVELMETMDPLVQYCYTAEDYAFQLEGRCRRILDQYDSTYREVITYRSKTEMDLVESKTAECLKLLEESIAAAEEDIGSWSRQKATEDGRVGQEDVDDKKSIADDVIREENDELKLIETNCREDLSDINKKLNEVDVALKDVKIKRDNQQRTYKGELERNQKRQKELRNELKQLEAEDEDLSSKIKRNDQLQEEANQEYVVCKGKVADMQQKIQKLLSMTNASIQLMKDMTGCMNEIVHTTRKEKQRVVKDLEHKRLLSNLQYRDALMAKIIFHHIRMEEVTKNLQDTKIEAADLSKDLRTAAKSGNKTRVERLKENLSLLETEGKNYEEKKEYHTKELHCLQEKCKQVDREIYAAGVKQLPTIEDRVKKWKIEQDKCFDDPNTGQFHSNITHV